jgi:hypothetical protein
LTTQPSALNPLYQQTANRVDTAAADQMRWNRPNTASPWAAQTSNPDGSVSLGFTGPMAGAQTNLTAQALRNMGGAMDFGQFNSGTGDEFRAKGIQSANAQMGDWLSPLQGKFDSAEKQRLLNAGYAEGSPEFEAQMSKGSGTAADLKSTLGNAAIGLGGEMGAKQQAMDLLSKQQGLAEALRQRSLPMEQLSAMQGLLEQPGFNPDDSIMGGATADLTQKLGNFWRQKGIAEDERRQLENDILDGFSAGASLIPVAGGFASGLAKGVKK